MTVLSQSAPFRITETLVTQTSIALTTTASNMHTSQANNTMWYCYTPSCNAITTPIRDNEFLQEFKIYHLQANLSLNSLKGTVDNDILNSTEDFSNPFNKNLKLKFRTSISIPDEMKDKT
ncbi:MAG: hypothetical protein MI922_03710, partial [Bacteroidales bacterium]|nr:hypothetical protein [Bacteroidales bacterium]